MRNNYLTPQIEIINIEIEDAILAQSGGISVETIREGETFGDSF